MLCLATTLVQSCGEMPRGVCRRVEKGLPRGLRGGSIDEGLWLDRLKMLIDRR